MKKVAPKKRKANTAEDVETALKAIESKILQYREMQATIIKVGVFIDNGVASVQFTGCNGLRMYAEGTLRNICVSALEGYQAELIMMTEKLLSNITGEQEKNT